MSSTSAAWSRRLLFPLSLVLAVSLASVGCGPSESAGAPDGTQRTPARIKTITAAILNTPSGMSGVTAGASSAGGWKGYNEVHSNGLFSTEPTSRKVTGLLAAEVPSLENGDLTLLPDGRMRVVYPLRQGVTWHDGVAFTARDLAFTTRILQDQGLPFNNGGAVAQQIASVETPDDHTFVATFNTPYFEAASHALSSFWPLPEHILGPIYEEYLVTRDASDFANDEYWTSGYVHLGPFRLTNWEPASTITFQAYDGYYRGRPKVDILRVQVFQEVNALFASLLAGTTDVLLDSVLNFERGTEIENRWHESGAGTVYIRPSTLRILIPQFRPAVQIEPANLDPNVRTALSLALDRGEMAAGLQAGHQETAAYGILLPNDPMYEAAKDTFRTHTYDPMRARTLLRDAGWALPTPDGVLQHASDGRRFRNVLSSTLDGTQQIAVIADYWRKVGLDVEEVVVPPAQSSNLEYRASYAGWEITSNTYPTLKGPGASAQTRWVGNRPGYDDPRLNALINTFQSSISEREQFQTMIAINDFIAANVLFLPLFGNSYHLGIRKGIRALDDREGGDGGMRLGSYSRNSHLWDVE